MNQGWEGGYYRSASVIRIKDYLLRLNNFEVEASPVGHT